MIGADFTISLSRDAFSRSEHGFASSLPAILTLIGIIFLLNLHSLGERPKIVEKPTAKVNSKDGLTYVRIPAGSFLMGCSPGDQECFSEEKPAHRVSLIKGFWIGQTEVTVAAYERFAGSFQIVLQRLM